MKLRFPHLALVGLAFAPACDSSSSEPGVATVTGRYSAGANISAQAEVLSVDDDGATQVVASANLAADGTFRIDTPAGEGPFLVQIVASAEVVGRVILPHDLNRGEEVATMTINAESAAEVAAYLAILAGDEARDDVDAIGLVTWVSARLAAETEAGSLGAAWMQFQDGYLATTAEAGVAISAETLAEIKTDAFKAFAASAGAVEDQIEFHQEVAADLSARLSLTQQVDAQLTASTLGAAALSGRAAELAADQGATLTAHVTWASQQAVASVDLQARLEAAYHGFFEALDRGEAMAAAQIELAAMLGGDGRVAVGSVLAAAATADGVSAAELRAAIASADGGLRVAIEAALSGGASGRVDAVASAITDARANARAHFEAALGNNFTARLASELFVVASHTEHLLTLDLITQISAGLRLDGVIEGQIGASLAALWTLSGDLIAEGEVSGNTWSIDGVASVDLDGPVVVVVTDANGQWRGAIVVDTRAQGDITVTTPITADTTARARVALELVGLGEGEGSAVAMLSLLADAEAQLVTDDASAATLAVAVAARAHLDAALGNLDAAVAGGVTATFVQAAVDAAEGSEDTAWRFTLLSRLEAAIAIDASAQGTLSGNRFADLRADIAATVDAFIEAAADASSSGEAEAAWQGFTAAMTTLTTTELSAALGLQGQLFTQLQSVLSAASEARVRFEAAVSGAFSGAVDRQSLDAAAEATARAAVTFASELTLDLSFIVDLVAHDQNAAARFVATVNAWGAVER